MPGQDAAEEGEEEAEQAVTDPLEVHWIDVLHCDRLVRHRDPNADLGDLDLGL
jgi:hypothetical protein